MVKKLFHSTLRTVYSYGHTGISGLYYNKYFLDSLNSSGILDLCIEIVTQKVWMPLMRSAMKPLSVSGSIRVISK